MCIVALRKVILLFLLSGFVASACSSVNPAASLTPITLQLDWLHSAQFAGFYAADQNGDYTREGLAVTFIQGGPSVNPLTPVLDGTAQFGLVGGDVLITARAEGQSLRAVATILRRDPFVFFSLANSGITRPEDFVGKKVLINPFARPRLYTMLARVGVTPEEITEVNAGDFTALYSGEIDVASGFVVDEVLRAQQAGYEVNIIYPDDYGVHFYSGTLFTSDDLTTTHPELVTRFLRATIQGWTYTIENPEVVGAMVLHYNPDADSAFETAKMTASLPFVNTGTDHIGWMSAEVWEGMAQTLRQQGILTTDLDVADVYTLQFLQQIYDGD
jgi:NitT/TauT family transport system substrate-binding protein